MQSGKFARHGRDQLCSTPMRRCTSTKGGAKEPVSVLYELLKDLLVRGIGGGSRDDHCKDGENAADCVKHGTAASAKNRRKRITENQ